VLLCDMCGAGVGAEMACTVPIPRNEASMQRSTVSPSVVLKYLFRVWCA
jgi:hypothetical protein